MNHHKVLMVLNRLEIGGAETHVVDLSASLQKLGWEVLVASGGGVYEQTLRELGIRHFTVPLDVRNAFRMRKAQQRLEQIIRQEKPDLVHAHARIPAFLCGRLYRKLGFPFVTTAHWTFEVNTLLRLMSNWGQHTIAVSEDIRDYLMDNYPISAGRIHVIPNGIDVDRFSAGSGEALRRELQIPQGAETVACVTRLHSSRADSARLLTEIAPELAAARPGIRIVIVGDGECLPELMQRAARVNATLGYPCLILTGGRTDVPDILNAADVFVGVSRAALEAMSCRKPVILCGNEGYGGVFRAESAERYKTTNYCCRDYPRSTAKALKHDILSVLEMTEDQREALGDDGRRIVEEDFSGQAMVRRTVRVYERAIHPGKTIVVSGYYGFRNAGDDAILEMICKDFSGDYELTVLSRRPRETARIYGVNTVHRFRILRVAGTVKQADLLLSGGGSILQDKTSTRSLLYYLGILKAAQQQGVPTMVYANGIGPIHRKRNRKRTARVLRNADAISLRDMDSADLVRQMCRGEKPRVTADPVFRMEASGNGAEVLSRAGIPEDAAIFAVSLRKMPRGEEQRMARLLDLAAEESGCDPVFLGMQIPADLEAARLVRARMKRNSYLLDSRVSGPEMISALQRTRGVLSMRFHTLVFGAVAGVPVMGFDEDPKLVSLLRELGALEPIKRSTFDPAMAAGQIAAQLRSGIRPDISRQRDRSLLDPETVRRLLYPEESRMAVHIIGGGDTGGAKTHVLSLLRGLMEQGCRVQLVCFLEGDFAAEAREAGIPTTVLPRNNIPWNLRWLIRYIRCRGADVVHCHGAKANMYGAMLMEHINVPVVTTVHSDPELDYLGRPMANLVFGTINRRALRQIRWHIYVSEELKNRVMKKNAAGEQLPCIYNGVDFSSKEKIIPRANWYEEMNIVLPSNAVIFGTAARLSPIKDVSTLITAFARVVHQYPQARLLIAGDGEEEKKLQHEAAQICPPGTVHFLGWIHDTRSFYNAIDVNVLTSISEGLPFAIPEGGQMRCATIATRVGGIPHIISDGENGLLLDPGDVQTLTDYMCRMIESPKERQRLGEAIFHRIRNHFSLEYMVRTQLEIYKTIQENTGKLNNPDTSR